MRANARLPGVCFDLEYQVRGLPQRGILARLMTAWIIKGSTTIRG